MMAHRSSAKNQSYVSVSLLELTSVQTEERTQISGTGPGSIPTYPVSHSTAAPQHLLFRGMVMRPIQSMIKCMSERRTTERH